MDICFVNMPFTDLDKPNIALSLFKAELQNENISCHIEYANHKFADMIGNKTYVNIGRVDSMLLLGEYLFRSGMEGYWENSGYCEYYNKYEEMILRSIKKVSNDEDAYKKFTMIFHHCGEIINRYLNQLTEDILMKEPSIVACSSSYQQNNASFSLLKKIKEVAPFVITMIGGSNCASEAGVAISEKMKFIDYVFSGEGDGIYPEIVREIVYGNNYIKKRLPYGLIRSGQYSSEDVPYRRVENLDELPFPDYSEFIQVCKSRNFSPTLLVEGSRGCWWREKSPCTFCGLDVAAQTFREKGTGRLVKEIETLSDTYQSKNFFLSDCILSNRHIAELPAGLKDKNYSIFSEVKTNIDKRQLKKLNEAGFSSIQPGIESLQDQMLRLMRKGNSKINHIAFLKHARELRIHTIWNILIGFPGERPEWIMEMVDLFPKITHLQPPGTLRHIIYQKNSEYFQHPSEYGLELQPAWPYQVIYGEDQQFIKSIAYNFEPAAEQDQELYYCFEKKGAVYRQLLEAVKSWMEAYYGSKNSLKYFSYDEKLEILDMRDIAAKNYYTLIAIEKEIYLRCEEPINKFRLKSLLSENYCGEEICSALESLLTKDLIIEGGDMLLALATNAKKLIY